MADHDLPPLTPLTPDAPQDVDPDAAARPAVAPTGTRPLGHVSVRFLFAHPAHLIALGAGSGLSPKAPGTVGTLWAWATFIAVGPWLSPLGWAWVIGASLPIGWWACTVAARHAGLADPGFIVWDEVVAFWLILWVIAPASGLMQLIAFGLFRYFDAAKPGPVGWADRRFKGGGWRGGFGILFDDLVAALCTLIVLALIERVLPAWS